MATAESQNSWQFPEPTLPEQLESSHEYRQVFAMTERLFPGPITVQRKHDPELPEEYVVFDVRAQGSFEQVMVRDREWHRECGELAPLSFHLYHLALMFDDDAE
jgi:hypothetical protein